MGDTFCLEGRRKRRDTPAFSWERSVGREATGPETHNQYRIAMSKILTREGLKKLEEELGDRKTRLRQEIAEAIKEAKEQGDLSENAEYSEAKHRQNENETRIMDLESTLKESTVVEKTTGSSSVTIGSSVVLDCKGKEMRFTIVGMNEVNPAEGLISGDSPFGKAIMGRSKGDEVVIEVPAGKLKCVVTSVK